MFIVGLLFLLKGADFLVEGSSSIAKRLGISELVIGLTIVAFGTSAPELLVNLVAGFKGNTDIAIGNILGSNIANILLILGLSALFSPLMIKRSTTWKEIPLNLLAVAVLFFMANDQIIDHSSVSVLTRIDGLVLIAFFFIFLAYTISLAKAEKEIIDDGIHKYSWLAAIGMSVGGLIALAVGGNWVVNGAVVLARQWQVSETLIGLTIVAVGTSLPELATSVVAAFKKKSDIAIGNIVGSNLFNILWILGISATLRPISIPSTANFDIGVCIAATFLLFVFCFTPKIRKKFILPQTYSLERLEGGILLGMYVVYVSFLIWRG